MKLLVAGSTGATGRRLVTLAVERGHQVTALSRHAPAAASREGVRMVQAQVTGNADDLVEVVRGHDALSPRLATPCSVREAIRR